MKKAQYESLNTILTQANYPLILMSLFAGIWTVKSRPDQPNVKIQNATLHFTRKTGWRRGVAFFKITNCSKYVDIIS